MQAAEDIAPKIARRVGWVELAPVSEADTVPNAVCGALGIRLSANLSPVEALHRRLRREAWVLILDNCEHVLGACAELVLNLIESCPQLHVLATSREALGITGEILCPASPLTVPDEADAEDTDKVASNTAVQLFVSRVRAARPDFAVTRENAEAIVRLCRKLEGIPLALELAAARVGVLTPSQIVGRLDRGIDLLKRSGRQALPRHQTMRAAIGWSHGLLTAAERTLFRRLSVFAGHADIEACEAACAGDGVDVREVLDLLEGLIGKSLVAADERGARARYRLLEPVRQFAQERLMASGELERVRERHARYYVERAEALGTRLKGPRRTAALDALELNHDNLRQAWDYAVEVENAALLARLACGLFWFWSFHGHVVEGRRRAERALGRLGAEADTAGRLHYVAGVLAWMQGDYAVAAERLEACLKQANSRGDQALKGLALREFAGVRFAGAELEAAAKCYDAAVTQLREVGADWDLALALVMQAEVRGRAGDKDCARQMLQEAQDLFGAAADPWGLSLACFGLGWAAAEAGDFTTARGEIQKALSLQDQAGDPWNTGQFLMLAGEVEELSGDFAAASGLYAKALSALREVGDRVSIAHGIARLAAVERRVGNARAAVRLAAAAKALGLPSNAPYPYALAANEDLADVIEALGEALEEEAFQSEWAAGQASALDDALEMALEGRAGGGGVGSARRAIAEDAALQLFALGPAQVRRDGRRLRAADWGFALPRELLYYLIAEGPRTKTQIGLEFWPEASHEQLKGRFRTTLYRLRQALGGTEWVQYREGRYAFNDSLDYWFDAEAFEAALDRAAGAAEPEASAVDLERALDLYRGDFLEDFPALDWAHPHRERLRRRYRGALMALGRLRDAGGAHERAAELYRRAVELDELDEEARRALARALAKMGDRGGALRQIDALAERLRAELAAEPADETKALRARLKG